MREINPRPAERKTPMSEQVCIEHDPDSGAYWVALPRRGRLGDRRLYDGETGRPVNIGPTYREPAPWNKVSDALAHFKRVADAFERLL